MDITLLLNNKMGSPVIYKGKDIRFASDDTFEQLSKQNELALIKNN